MVTSTFMLTNKMIRILLLLTECYLILILISIFPFQLLILVIYILDLIITNASLKLVISPKLCDTYISDDKTVYIDLDIQKPIAQKSFSTFRPLNKINFTDFSNDITAAFSNFEHLDLNSLISHFNSTLSSLLGKHTPEKNCSYHNSFLQSMVYA